MTNYNITSIPSDDDLRPIILESIALLHTQIALDIAALTDDRFSDDDTDYFPARADTLAYLIATMTAAHEYPLSDAIHDLLTRDDHSDHLLDLPTCDFDTPFHNLMRRLTNDFDIYD